MKDVSFTIFFDFISNSNNLKELTNLDIYIKQLKDGILGGFFTCRMFFDQKFKFSFECFT